MSMKKVMIFARGYEAMNHCLELMKSNDVAKSFVESDKEKIVSILVEGMSRDEANSVLTILGL